MSETRAQGIERQSQPNLGGSTDFTGRGVGLDEIGRAMIEAGYFPEFAGGADIQADGTVVDEAAIALDAISEAIGGRERYIEGEGPDADLTAFSEQLSEQGIDISMSNDDIMAALKDGQPGGQSGQDGQTYDQNGQLITDTPEFRAWFGDSKVVDESGEPLTVYHGSGTLIDEFKPEFTGQGNDQFGSGFYFSSERGTADSYTTARLNPDQEKLGGEDSANVVEAYLSIKSPIEVSGANLTDSSADISAEQAIQIIMKSPNLYDVDNTPIGNWHDVWADGVQEWMIKDVAAQYTGSTLLSLEGDFFANDATAFREAVNEATGYDGVIQTFPSGEKHFIAWFPTQIKSVDNQGTFDANDPRILFQQDGPEQPLAVAHNISARGLQIADGLGGLAAPSLGVVRADIGPLDGFGEITLIAGPELADPKQSGVRAFNADVYSVRQPRALTAITKKDKATIEKRLDPASEELGGRFYDLDVNDFERSGLTYLADQPEVKLAYLRDQGISFRVPMTKLPEVPKDLRRIVSGKIFEVRKDPKMMAAITDHFGRLADELIERLPEKFSDRSSTPYFEADGTPEINQFNRLVNNIATSKESRKPDYFAARSALAKKIDATNTRQSDFLGWVEDQFSENTGGLFFEKPNGRRVPYDLDELVRFMRGKVRDAEGFNFGLGNIRSNMAREFTSISQIKGARSDIVTKAEFEVVKKEVGAEFEALMDRLKPHLHGSDGYGHFNRASEFLGDMAKGNMRDWSGDNMVAPLTPELTTDIRSFLSKLKVLPTEYFEVKMSTCLSFPRLWFPSLQVRRL